MAYNECVSQLGLEWLMIRLHCGNANIKIGKGYIETCLEESKYDSERWNCLR
jgi:hypothetical protein